MPAAAISADVNTTLLRDISFKVVALKRFSGLYSVVEVVVPVPIYAVVCAVTAWWVRVNPNTNAINNMPDLEAAVMRVRVRPKKV